MRRPSRTNLGSNFLTSEEIILPMRGVVFKFCLIASAVEVEIDTHGAMYERRPRTSITGAGGIAGVLEALRTHPKDVEVQR